MDNIRFGSFVAQLRKERGLTQKELAQRLHVTDKAVSKWETGRGFPDLKLLEPLAQTLEVSLVELLQGERTSSPTLSVEEAGQVAAETAHIGVDRHTVVIENNDHGLPGGAGIVEPLEAEATGHGTVADQGDNAVILVEQGSGVGHTQGHRNGVGGVACDESNMLALIGLGKARKTAQLPQCMKQRLSPGQNLMAVALVSHIKNQTVLGGVKHPMNSHRQLHDAQVGGQMTTGFRHIFHQKVPKLPAKLVHLGTIQ